MCSKKYHAVYTFFLLDHETTPIFDLTLVATDKGNPPRNGKMTLRVRVTDANDNAPVFTKSVS